MDCTRGVCNGMSKRLLPVEEAGVVRTVDVSTMLDRCIDGKLWHVHHKFQFESYSESGEVRSRVELTGTFRHNSCSIAYDAHELQGSACSLCRGIVNLDDFRHRARRLGELGQQAPEGFNDRYMSHQEALSKLSELEARQSKARRERTWHIFKICALTSRVKTLREKAVESCKRGDVRRLIDDLQYCAAQGKVERKQVLFNFISDAVRSVRSWTSWTSISCVIKKTPPSSLTPPSPVDVLPLLLQVRLDGKMSHYHESTHRCYEILKHYGGPRSHRFIEANLAGPHLRTTGKRWAKFMEHYELGFDEKSFIFLARFYTAVLKKLGIPLGCVPSECSEDESACQDEPRWNQRRDQLVGF